MTTAIELGQEEAFEVRRAIEAEIRASERAVSAHWMANHQAPGGLAERCQQSIKVLRSVLEKLPEC